MCLAFPAKIIELNGTLAKAATDGNRWEVNLVLLPEARLEDWVLVHAGFGLEIIDEQRAEETLSLLKKLEETGEVEA